MKTIIIISLIVMAGWQPVSAQQVPDNKKEINKIIEIYSKSVIDRDSVLFYSLFNEGNVTWCAALKDRSIASDHAKRSYFSGSYQQFFRGLFRYNHTEDKFDNIRIIEDGTVATVAMDYSFWADNKMTNWGGKYLTLIKRQGSWKIASVIYSLELTSYFEQPPLSERQANGQ